MSTPRKETFVLRNNLGRKISTVEDSRRPSSESPVSHNQKCSESSSRTPNKDQSDRNKLDSQLKMQQIDRKFHVLRTEVVPDVIEQHCSFMIQFNGMLQDRDVTEETKFIAETKLLELQGQLETFENTLDILRPNKNFPVEENARMLNVLEREINRLRTRLPIYAYRSMLIDQIRSHRVIIIKADAGFGKSTQTVQYLLDAGFADSGQIICTQHQSVTVESLASLVSNDFKCRVGEKVGANTGLSSPQISPQTRICFVTDTVLMDAYRVDPLLRNYSMVVIDDVHERSINTDLLLGIMKRCLRQRKDMKLILLSGLFDTTQLIDYYDDVHLIEMGLPTFPIDDEYTSENPDDYLDAAIQKALEVHATQMPGDILVFVADSKDIDLAVQKTDHELKTSDPAVVLRLHDQLYGEAVRKVFMPNNAGHRKIIFSTHIAESSMPIDGIRYVIDSGMVKETVWDATRNIQVLRVGYAAQTAVCQRRASAGRTLSGKCYHLYTEDTYKTFDIHPQPDILRQQLTMAVLKLKYMNIWDKVSPFEWLEAPSPQSLADASVQLKLLGTLKSNTEEITALGLCMAKLDVEPLLSAMILAGQQYNCLDCTLIIAGMLSVVHNIWWFGGIKKFSKETNDRTRASFTHDLNIGGDYITLLRIFLEWNSLGTDKQIRYDWCRTHAVHDQSLRVALEFAKRIAFKLDPKFKLQFPAPSELNDNLIERVTRCVCAGFFQHLAMSNGTTRAGYKIVDNLSQIVAQVDPLSTLMFMQTVPNFVLYQNMLRIGQNNYLTVLCPIDIKWLPQSWLNKLPQAALQHRSDNYTFDNLGATLLLSLVGKKLSNIPELEQSLQVTFNVNYPQTMFTIHGQPEQIRHAQQQLVQMLNQKRQKLRTDVQEFEVVGSTRILLGAGAEPQLVLVKDEFVTVSLSNLPINVTEDELRRCCERYGEVRTMSAIERQQQHDSSVLVTYSTYESAQKAVTHLSHEIWNGREVVVSPRFLRPSIYESSQNCYLKALWFMTESEGKGRMTFSQHQAAKEAVKLLEQHGYSCQLQTRTTNPVLKCSWPVESHTSKAMVWFPTKQATEQALQVAYPFTLRVERNLKQHTLLNVYNVPAEFDEEDLKGIFSGCSDAQLTYNVGSNKLKMPTGIKDDIYRIFSMYRSFRHELVQIQSKLNNGRVEVYVQLTNKQELEAAIRSMNGKTGFIGATKIRLSISEQDIAESKDISDRPMPMTEFTIILSQLPSNMYEELLEDLLNQHQLSDYLTSVTIFRQNLSAKRSLNIVSDTDEENLINQVTLHSLFSLRNTFHSVPDIQICSATTDGRGMAFIIFSDPRDVMTVMNIYKSSLDSNQLTMGQYTLHLVPNIDHTIRLNAALAQAIPGKLQHTIETIKNDSTLSDITLRKKVTFKDSEEISSIIIQGGDIQQITKARNIFDNLMKGLQFKFHNSSWVDVIFNPAGKKFLSELQNCTGTYIWWSWSSTFVRIFGEDRVCNDVYQKIDEFIQKELARLKYSIYLTIPKGCLRQCANRSRDIKALGGAKARIIIDLLKNYIKISGDRTSVNECREKVKDLLNKLSSATTHLLADSSKITSDVDNRSTCPICLSFFESPYSLQQCAHRYCRSCLNDYFNTRFDTTMSMKNFRLVCPIGGCDQICLISDIQSIIDHENMMRLATIAFQIYIRQANNDLEQCFGINCKQVYRPSLNVSTYFCDQCNKIFCISCQVELHTEMTCEQYQRVAREKKDKQLMIENLGELPFKQCPKCRTLIEKFAGCNAMKCTQCDIAFCWRCELTDDDDVHYHYSDPKSTCYQKCFDADDWQS